MAGELIRNAFPAIAASNIAARQVVGLASGGDRHVAPVGSHNLRPFGIALTVATQADAVTVHDAGNVVKAVAAASVGRGAPVGIVGATSSIGPVSGASGSVVHAVGDSVSAAAAGEVFSVFVNPRQLSGNP